MPLVQLAASQWRSSRPGVSRAAGASGADGRHSLAPSTSYYARRLSGVAAPQGRSLARPDARLDGHCRRQRNYRLRTSTEERYRQYKCFNNLTDFTSRAFSLVVNQVIFIMLAVNLLQYYLLRQGRKKLNKKPLPSIRRELVPSDSYIIVYWQNYFGLFSALELTQILVTLREEARQKIAMRCRRLKGELAGLLSNPRPT